MRVLVACEFSGTVRDAFSKKGHDAWSCDLLPTESPGNHIQGNVLDMLGEGWDLMIAHPPCTHLAVSGAVWFPKKKKRQQKALEFFLTLLNAPIKKICVENPVCVASSRIRTPNQIIQPYQFGDKERKTTCLWLKNLPPLQPTKIVRPKLIVYKSKKYPNKKYIMPNWHETSPPKGISRGHARSVTFQGIAEAMATQWGRLGDSYTEGFGWFPPDRLKGVPRIGTCRNGGESVY